MPDTEPSAEKPTKRDWGPLLAAGAGIIGVLVGSGFTAWQNERTIDAQVEGQKRELSDQRDRIAREQRLPVYRKFEYAATKYADVETRRHACESANKPCSTSLDEVEDARREFQIAINDMSIFGSVTAQELVVQVVNAVPSPKNGLSDTPRVGPVDEQELDAAIIAFQDQTCVDVSPDPDSCEVSRGGRLGP